MSKPNIRNYDETVADVASGQRKREEIAMNLMHSAATEETTRRLILEVLLDIRDLLQEIVAK